MTAVNTYAPPTTAQCLLLAMQDYQKAVVRHAVWLAENSNATPQGERDEAALLADMDESLVLLKAALAKANLSAKALGWVL